MPSKYALTCCIALCAPSLALANGGIALENYDRSVAPGEDFYRHVNGTWLKNTQIPADRSNFGAFSEIEVNAEEQLRAILEEAASGTSKDPKTRKLGALYAAFLDSERVEQLGGAPLDRDLQQIDARLGSHADLPAVLGQLSRLGVASPLGAFVSRDAKDPLRYVLYLTQWGLGLPDRDYYLSDEAQFRQTRQDYLAYMQKMLQLIGTPNAGTAARKILQLETALAEAQWTKVAARDAVKSYNPYTPEELAELSPGLDLWAALQAADAPAGKIVVRQPSFFAALGPILQKADIGTLREYLRLRTTEAYAPYLSSRFVQTHFDFYGRILSGISELRPRWKRGLDAVETAAGFLLGEAYVERHYPAEAARRMDELVANLILAYEQSIRELPWMGEATKEEALRKLAAFRPKVGHPRNWRDYSALQVRADDLYGNMRRAALFEHQRQVRKIGQPADPDEWHMTPQTVNAYYSPTANEIVFPAAILQPPFFDVSADDAANYGAIGAVIGHEIGHGFDDQGSRYDGDGNLRNWWTDEDRARFEERTKILIAQYDAFEALPGQKVNGALTIGENIGDIGGLSIAYQAWVLSLGGKEAAEIDGMSGAQRFFAGWAQVWRRLYREPELIKRLKADPHAPSAFRVNGVVVHIPAFYEAYKVDSKAPMYRAPEDRVRIW